MPLSTMPTMDPNQILAMLQARGATLPPNALQLIQAWQARRAQMQPAQFFQNGANGQATNRFAAMQNWRAQFPQLGQAGQRGVANAGAPNWQSNWQPGQGMGAAGGYANPVFMNPLQPGNPVTAPGTPIPQASQFTNGDAYGGAFASPGGKGGGVGRMMTGGNPNYAAMR